jgi:Fuc2NAc and GlcNAc transferase
MSTRRALISLRLSEAGRLAYQHAARQCGGHRPVTLAMGAINLCWLLPIALLVALESLGGLFGVLIAYAPLVGAAVWLRAGKSSSE